jgi:hypothetical protein
MSSAFWEILLLTAADTRRSAPSDSKQQQKQCEELLHVVPGQGTKQAWVYSKLYACGTAAAAASQLFPSKSAWPEALTTQNGADLKAKGFGT